MASPTVEISQTAQEYIEAQLNLEHEAREVLPYAFDQCTYTMGPLRQLVFACLSCTPPGSQPAGVCYSCSISCHGSHGEIVELFAKRGFTCDCGTERFPNADCCLRKCSGEKAAPNTYNQNFRGYFCENELYEADKELGTMYQCLLGDVCKEDWFHDRCILGLGSKPESDDAKSSNPTGPAEARDNDGVQDEAMAGAEAEEPRPSDAAAAHVEAEADSEERLKGFPSEESFEHFICWQCVSNNPWLKRYSGAPGFLDAVVKQDIRPEQAPMKQADAQATSEGTGTKSKKRKAEDELMPDAGAVKRSKTPEPTLPSLPTASETVVESADPGDCKLPDLAPSLADQTVSLFLKEDFRKTLCKCRSCYLLLSEFHVLLEEEETYKPPLDSDHDDTSAHESLFDAGQKALNTMDRVKAIEGVMAYNMLKEKVREFLKPFADENRVVGAEDVKKYFEELRGDKSQGVPEASSNKSDENGGKGDGNDNRKEQSGY